MTVLIITLFLRILALGITLAPWGLAVAALIGGLCLLPLGGRRRADGSMPCLLQSAGIRVISRTASRGGAHVPALGTDAPAAVVRGRRQRLVC